MAVYPLETHVTRTYMLRKVTAQRIKRVAIEHQVYDSSVADWLLSRALDELEHGDLTIRRRPVAWKIDRSDEGLEDG